MMIRYQIVVPFLLCILTLWMESCDIPEEQISGDSSLRLEASEDSIKFDTVLSSVRSITQRVNIHNRNKRAVRISELSLGLGESSSYSLFVNGINGKSFQDHVIFGGDSLLVLIEVNISPRDQDDAFAVNDRIQISYNENRLEVPLVTWGQDAIFLEREEVTCDAIWVAGKPYVLKDTITVREGCALTIEPGARLLIENESALRVNGQLLMQGTAEEKIIVRNTRSDGSFRIRPGQWNAIFFTETSTGNQVNHAEIINGRIGLFIDHPDNDETFELTVTNTTIGHMSTAGIRSFSSDVKMENVEIYNCQSELIGGFAGGKYEITHCSFSNANTDFSRSEESVFFSEEEEVNGEMRSGPLDLTLTNSIIWGGRREELSVLVTDQNKLSGITHNIIRSELPVWEQMENEISLESNYPGFICTSNPDSCSTFFQLRLGVNSVARAKAVNSTVMLDIEGRMRDDMPDLGAYEWYDRKQEEPSESLP